VLKERVLRSVTHPHQPRGGLVGDAHYTGNKRTAVVLCELMLRLNGCRGEISNDRFYRLAYAVAQGKMQDPYALKEVAFGKGLFEGEVFRKIDFSL